MRRDVGYVFLGVGAGLVSGVASYVFLTLLEHVIELRLEHGWLVWLLPLGGLIVGLGYHYLGGRAAGGTALAVSEAHAYTRGSPARMAPLILIGTLVGQLVGASIGREGTGVQMASSLTDAGARVLRLDHDHRAQLARASLAAGFGSVFGVPFAGVVFGMEVARRRTLRALLSAIPAAFVGDWVVDRLGRERAVYPHVSVPFGLGALITLPCGAVVFGITAWVFRAAVPRLKRAFASLVSWPPLRPVLGGLATAGLVILFGRDYLGLSLPLGIEALAGAHLDWWDPVLKLVFTAVALGSGFVGGEVTPLFVVGATLGSVLSAPLALPATTLAALGMAAVFGAAANVPLTCAVLAVELFGGGIALPALAVCLLARLCSGREGIYDHPAASMMDPAPR